MEISYSEESTQPVERSRSFTEYQVLDYYSAVHPCASTAAVGKPGRGTLHCLALFFQEGVPFPPNMWLFFYSTCLLAQFLPFPPLVCCFVSSFGEADKPGNLGQWQGLANDQLWNIFCWRGAASFHEWDKCPAAEYILVISSSLGRANRAPRMAKFILCYFSSREVSGSHS